MKEFRTEIKVTASPVAMHMESRVLTQGSCFADAIGNRLENVKIEALVNPFGVIYNPESIHKVLAGAIFNEPVPAHTFLQHQGIHLNYNFHSQLSALTKEQLVSTLTNVIGSVHYFLKDAGWLLLTYGTAWRYQRKDTGEVVANCHKLPASSFIKSLLTPEAVVSSFREFYSQLKKLNPDIRIVLTVSPVRHLKDTLELNSVSKAVLRLACHTIAASYDDVDYFPAYEMMTDDLRDYRFYKADMLHPTTQAEDYIWEKFMERYFSSDLHDFVAKWRPLLSAMRHQPFHPESSSHQRFLKDTLDRLEELKRRVDVQKEIDWVKRQITK